MDIRLSEVETPVASSDPQIVNAGVEAHGSNATDEASQDDNGESNPNERE
jgi:hypothetical protein